jgi:hypothetical protein
MAINIPDHWKRICGIHVEADGRVGAVWLALDTTTSVADLYDCALFDREVMAVVGQGIAGRGRWIPVAYRKQDSEFARKLFNECGVDILPEPVMDSQAMAEISARTIRQMIRASQLVVEPEVAEFRREFERYNMQDSQVPLKDFPLMSALRHAVEKIDWARAQTMGRSRRPCSPKLAVV